MGCLVMGLLVMGRANPSHYSLQYSCTVLYHCLRNKIMSCLLKCITVLHEYVLVMWTNKLLIKGQ